MFLGSIPLKQLTKARIKDFKTSLKSKSRGGMVVILVPAGAVKISQKSQISEENDIVVLSSMYKIKVCSYDCNICHM